MAAGVSFACDRAAGEVAVYAIKASRHLACELLPDAGMNIRARVAFLATVFVTAVTTAACSQATTSISSPSSTVPGSAPPSSTQGLAAVSPNTEWKLQSLATTGSPVVTIADQALFTFTLDNAGRLSAKADCNRASASYTTAGDTLSTGLMASTMAACAAAPLDTQFLALLSGDNVATSDGLTLELSSSRGTLHFVR
jgi:heat shock protein HslJ